jgi:hypothetical protein
MKIGNIMVNQIKVVQEDVKSFFKYERSYNDCLKDVKNKN